MGMVNYFVLQKYDNYYQDKETQRLLVFCDFPEPEMTSGRLYNMTGVQVAGFQNSKILKDRRVISYGALPKGVYLLEVLHGGKKFSIGRVEF